MIKKTQKNLHAYMIKDSIKKNPQQEKELFQNYVDFGTSELIYFHYSNSWLLYLNKRRKFRTFSV